eukprot:scaffold40512_cov59-Attheya_sp.AAC.3
MMRDFVYYFAIGLPQASTPAAAGGDCTAAPTKNATGPISRIRLGVEISRPSIAHAHRSACSHLTISPDAFCALISVFAIGASPSLSPAAVGGDSTVATTTGSSYYYLPHSCGCLCQWSFHFAEPCIPTHAAP